MFGRKEAKRAKERAAFAEKLDGKHIRYVTERKDGLDEVIGREGGLNVRDGELIVYADQTVLFRAKTEELDASELLSLEGVVLIGKDIEHGGAERFLIAYYKYYR